MARLRVASVLAGLPILLAPSAGATPAPASTIAEAQLRAINHQVVNAYAHPDRDFMDRVTANDFLLTDVSGAWLERRRHLARLHTPWLREGVSYDDVKVRVYGPVALVHGLFESRGTGDAARRVRYTDVYQWNGTQWQLVNAQNTPLRDGVARPLQQGKAPAHAPWRGEDPVGDDLDVLRELNENYVRAYREADVAWYDAHLAPDYVVVNSDGSYLDRARALAEFAEPSYAVYMRSFPVGKVRIRRFGDIALIHAENAYERKDRRRGVNRYTDIWRRQADGRWLCIAAHITTHKPPA
jgi:ketosteroid isomerase-like protein